MELQLYVVLLSSAHFYVNSTLKQINSNVTRILISDSINYKCISLRRSLRYQFSKLEQNVDEPYPSSSASTTRYGFLAISPVGTIAAAVTQQVVYATVPLTLAMSLILTKRQQFLQLTQ